MPDNKVYIFDTTLRDGEQSPGASMNAVEKLSIARQLEKLGVDVIEAGFPIASDGDFEAVKLVAEEVRGPEIAGLCRTGRLDIDRAWEALQHAQNPRIHTFIATSDIHLKHKLGKTREQVYEDVIEAVRYARSLCDNVEFSAEDATRSDLDYLCSIVEAAIEAGARTVNIPDTVGYTYPTEFKRIISTIIERVKGIEKIVLSVHCHNDLGLAVANSLAAVEGGARQIECTINGIGERAGNTSLEEVVMAFKTRKDILDYTTGVHSEHIYPASRMLTSITGIAVQPNKAIVGDNAFAHEAGIHQDGVLKKTLTYEIMTPESVGLASNKLVMGKHSGRHAFRKRLEELGFELTGDEFAKAFKRFKKLADTKKDVYDEDLEALVADEVLRVPDTFDLKHINVNSGTELIPTATVVLKINDEEIKEAGFGDGPVDAAFKTIAKITQTQSRLLKYAVQSITGGTDAQGEVTVRLTEGGVDVIGRGAHEDIIVASAKAYVNALNKLERRKKAGQDIKKQAP